MTKKPQEIINILLDQRITVSLSPKNNGNLFIDGDLNLATVKLLKANKPHLIEYLTHDIAQMVSRDAKIPYRVMREGKLTDSQWSGITPIINDIVKRNPNRLDDVTAFNSWLDMCQVKPDDNKQKKELVYQIIKNLIKTAKYTDEVKGYAMQLLENEDTLSSTPLSELKQFMSDINDSL